MNTISRITLSLFFALAASFAQTNTLTQTTTSAAALASDKVISVTSATGISAPAVGTVGTQLYVISPGNQRGEAMIVQAVSGTSITVARGRAGAPQAAIPSGARVLIGNQNWFYNYDPSGGCTTASTFVSPWVNTKTGSQWLCSTLTLSWVPGFGNTIAPAQPTTAVASAAGLVTPSGPLFHITGTLAITGFTLPIGFAGSSITVIPDAIFTTTAATNIGLASTAVVGKALIYTYDAVTAKFYPSY